MSQASTRTAAPVRQLRHDSRDQLLCTAPGQNRFVMSETDIVLECYRSQIHKADFQHKLEVFSDRVMSIMNWCEGQPRVKAAFVCAHGTKYIVPILACDEDPDGDLHDAMVTLELELNKGDLQEFDFILLRSAEDRGLQCIVDVQKTEMIFNRAVGS